MGDGLPRVCYCTNVIATGEGVAEAIGAFVSGARRAGWGDCEPMPVGVWLPAEALRGVVGSVEEGAGRGAIEAALERGRVFGEALRGVGAEPVTINGFPHGAFQSGMVRERVYEPGWADGVRSAFTRGLAVLAAGMVDRDAGAHGVSVSTVPVGWPRGGSEDGVVLAEAGRRLREMSVFLATLESVTGVRVTVDLEPEPGCLLDRAPDVVRFFEAELPDETHRRHIGVCHDVCHSAVMFEGQAGAIAAYRSAGVRVNKVQVSSAVRALGGGPDAAAGIVAMNEPRYLHQSVVRRGDGSGDAFFVDAADAARSLGDRGLGPEDEIRMHLHVPVFLDSFEVTIGDGAARLSTTNWAIAEACEAVLRDWGGDAGSLPVFEVETYTWPVLRGDAGDGGLHAGAVREMRWAEGVLIAAAAGGGGLL